MNENLIISRKSLQAEAQAKINMGKAPGVKLVDFAGPRLSGRFEKMDQGARFDAIKGLNARDMIPSMVDPTFQRTKKYGGGFHVPMNWAGDDVEMSVYERILSRQFQMSANTLPEDWTNLWDAIRIDVSIRKAGLPTIRQFIYNITNNPNFTRQVNPTEITPIGIVFEENTGQGQSVNQGETTGGGFDTFTILIYAAGFTWDLLGELFDLTISPERIADAVSVGENALKDNIAISPILDFSYAGVQQTAASAIGSKRQELLYNTLVDGLDDLGNRNHPLTDRKLNVMDVVILAHPFDARHIAQVSNGLPSDNQIFYPTLREINRVIAYDDEIIRQRTKVTTYSGVTQGTVYMIIPASALPADGYMEIAVKRDLVIEIDTQPNVANLTREQRAYWFAEGLWTHGIQYFIQEITLPTW